MTKIMFNSELELGRAIASLDLIPEAYRAISGTNLPYEIHTSRSGISVLAFNCFPDYTAPFLNNEFDLVQSENYPIVDFISTKVNPSFSINKAAVELFLQHSDPLKEVENQHINKPLIITGWGVGGYLAILSTLCLHHAIEVEESKGGKNTKRPICITFGSPLIGDAALQRAITERPRWKSSLVNVVAKADPVASFFSATTAYKPLGTFLFCTESGGYAAFEDQDSILLVLNAMKSSNQGSSGTYDYKNVLGAMRKRLLYRGGSESGDFGLNPLRVGITLQLREVGVLGDISNDQIGKIEEKHIKKIKIKNSANAYDPSKKLNEMKISLTYMEWYMKTRKEKGGYYDSYKVEMQSQNEILLHHRRLNQYWKKLVEDKEILPQKEGVKLRKRWLYGGTNYRRIVEPLDIAEYYKKGNVNYIEKRSNHFKLLEKWSNEDRKESNSGEEKRHKAASLTEDSCFWARVEEALIGLRVVENGSGSSELERELVRFEDYVMGEIEKFAVSPDVFLKGSSLMKWWSKYKAYKGAAYASEFAAYMNNEKYLSYE